MLIDVGTCLQDAPDERVNHSILKRAAEFKIGKFFCSGFCPEDWSLVHSLAREEEQIVPFFGIHPWYANQVPAAWEKQLMHMVSLDTGAGIGTIGLDRSKSGGDFENQKKVFLSQIEIAKRLSRPIAIHCAMAFEDMLPLLRDHKAQLTRFMIHAYQGDSKTLEQLLKLGAYISFSRKSLLFGDVLVLNLVRQVPKDRLLLETSFPHMNSNKIDTGISFDMYFKCLRETYALAARATGTDAEDLRGAVWNNSITYLSGNLPSKKESANGRL